MPFRTACPTCQSSYLLNEQQDGQSVRCKYCSAPFIAHSFNNPPPRVQAIPLAREDSGPGRPPPRPPTPAPRKAKGVTPPPRPPKRQLEIDVEEERTPPPARMNLGFVGGLVALVVLFGALLWMFAASAVTNDKGGGQASIDSVPPPVAAEVPPAAGPAKADAPLPFGPARDVASALVLLRSASSADRKAALTWLGSAAVDPERRDDVAKALNEVLGDAQLREAALLAVARWGSTINAGKLVGLLEEPMSVHWKPIVEILVKMDDDVAQEAVARQLLTPTRASQVATALRSAPPRAAEKHVARYMHHHEPTVREDAGRLLRHYGTSDAVKVEQSIHDVEARDIRTRYSACEWLAKQKPLAELQEKAARALEGRLDDRVDVGIVAMAALESWATKDSVNPVCRAMDHVRYQPSALRILLRLKDEECIGTLVRYLDSPLWDSVAKVLVQFGEKAEKPTWPLLQNQSPVLRARAVEILAEVGGKESIEKLTKLAERDKLNRARAQAAVRKIKARLK